MPFSRLASRVFASAPVSQGGGGQSSGEGGIGGLFDLFNKTPLKPLHNFYINRFRICIEYSYIFLIYQNLQ